MAKLEASPPDPLPAVFPLTVTLVAVRLPAVPPPAWLASAVLPLMVVFVSETDPLLTNPPPATAALLSRIVLSVITAVEMVEPI
ncbi:MAG: hypothetical protein AB7E67_07625 [Xanthobacteraceae bacterium]